MRLLNRAVELVTAMACVVAAVVVTSPAADAAVTYWYMPSHPMNRSPKSLPNSDCTGGWGVRSNLNNVPYFLTAGHCFTAGQDVYGTHGRFGITANSHHASGGVDTAIVAPLSGVDGLQEIPGLGRAVGKMSNGWSTTGGNGIAMQSPRTGRVYGTIAGGWRAWFNGRRVACGTYPSQDGDSGAPMFVHNAGGVFAAGVHVGLLTENGVTMACFVTIDDLLADWNAWLPVFSSAVARTGAASADVRLQADLSGPAETLPIRYVGEPIPE
ncbi:hypothetical protein [Saccharothrix deserti]|uniref:hypothetical protein n=1 Tax=Saccharothrix deserti TaxID=2593674 RepID=UPI00131B2994|nr:hypothetical protein [Saccharothrix deserti]